MRSKFVPLLVLAAVGCGSSDFATATVSTNALGGSGTPGTATAPMSSAAGGSSGGGAAAAADGGSTSTSTGDESASPCGILRQAEELLDVELCVAAGTFTMGSSSPNLGNGHADHTPPHQVSLSAFAIDAFEVSVARYRNCVVAGRCGAASVDTTRGCTYTEVSGPSDGLPISCVTAAEAEQFCLWDGKRRLPTEAEWERTARSTDERPYPWGSGFACDRAVASANGACASTHKSLQPGGSMPLGDSAEGAHDLAGNVAEWVKDYASSYPAGTVVDPAGPDTGVSRILRGGSLTSNAPDTQTFVRLTTSGTVIGANGFRCARSTSQ